MKEFILMMVVLLGLGCYLIKDNGAGAGAVITDMRDQTEAQFGALGKDKTCDYTYTYTYLVKAGETLFSIGQKLEIPWQKIAQDNHLKELWVIQSGQRLKMHLSAPKRDEVLASWYGKPFHGRKMASGKQYNMYKLLAAHKTLPLGTKVRLENPENGIVLVLEIQDRGPYIPGRQFDVSRQAAQVLGFKEKGLAKLRMEILEFG